jgi:alpha-maltose-1-phosphate synthase
MTVLFGHPAGNPNSYHAAMAYFEAGFLECFCVPWIPSTRTLDVLSALWPSRSLVQRFARRQFPPLADAPKVQGRVEEFCRLLVRASGFGAGHFPDQPNRWLMRTMARECNRASVTAVHAYEDCSLWSFKQAKRFSKACVYDMPTCYFPDWEKIRVELHRTYGDWLPSSGALAAEEWRLEQKREEMALADLTLVASRYVEGTIRKFYPHKEIARIPYGVDVEFWAPELTEKSSQPLRFIYAGQVSLRKGVPLLVEAWSKAELRDAELTLVGSWALADSKRAALPPGVRWVPPCSSQALRDRYRESDVFVFPSFSDGFGLVLLEAMACGLPAVASTASIGPEIITPDCGFVISPGDVDQLVERLRWFDQHRDEIPAMAKAARSQAELCTWSNYRTLVTRAVAKFI